MNTARIALAALAATVVDGIYGFAVYGAALSNQFGAFPAVFRSAESGPAYLPAMFAGILVGMFAVTYIDLPVHFGRRRAEREGGQGMMG